MKTIVHTLITFMVFLSPQVNGDWDELYEKEGVSLFKNDSALPGEPKIKGEKKIEAPYKLVVGLLMDNDNRSKWIDSIQVSKIIHREDGANRLIAYQKFSSPFPFSDRDFVMEVDWVLQDDYFEIDTRPTEHEDAPILIEEGIVRGSMRARYVVKKLNGNSIVSLEAHIDPSGDIPEFIVEDMQESFILKSLNNMGETVNEQWVKDAYGN